MNNNQNSSNKLGGGYYDYTSAARTSTSKVDQQQLTIGELFGLSTTRATSAVVSDNDFVPANVKQQIELWERELNCIQTRPAVMVLINTQQSAQRFITYCQ